MSPISRAALAPDVGIIVPAAGRGERAGGAEPKQFRPIAGVPMLLRAIRPFAQHPRVCEIVVALPARVASSPPGWLTEVAGARLRLVAGGLTRAESVLAGLAALSAESVLVLVHDAARPFVSQETVAAVLARAATGVGAVAAVPVADTLKRAADGTRVTETVSRHGLWRAQTPQGFPRGMLEDAYRAWGATPGRTEATDDAAIVEAAGFPVELVPDHSTNMKITTPEDFTVAEALASR